MIEKEKKHGFMKIIREGLGFISQILSASIFPPIAEGAEMIMKNIDGRILKVEKRILRKISSFLVIGFGVMFLIFALFFFLTEYLKWSNSVSFLSIGTIIVVIGLLLKLGESDK